MNRPLPDVYEFSETHLYYDNKKKNAVKPPWFINCTRQQAEDILRRFEQYGNVLLRPNSSFKTNGYYALSAATITNKETKFVHYVIAKSNSGFTLEIQKKPAPMPCLEDILNYYISAAGSHKHNAMVLDPTESVGQQKPSYINLSQTPVANGSANGRYEDRQLDRVIPTSNGKTGSVNGVSQQKKSSYVNLPQTSASNGQGNGDYLEMHGHGSPWSSNLKRRVSEPVPKATAKDYVNVPKTCHGARCVSEHRDNQNGDKFGNTVANGRDYINVNSDAPTISQGMHKAASFPPYGANDDEDDYLRPSPGTRKAPAVPYKR